jgi:hypothetical protein
VRLPLAATHLARVIHVTSAGSLARAVEDKRLELKSTGPEDELVLERLRALAREEKILCEEARALATARKWPTDLAGQPYGWVRLRGDTARGALPRIDRIYAREIFELSEAARASDDDEVVSLVLATLDGRRSIAAELVGLAPQDTLPGAK